MKRLAFMPMSKEQGTKMAHYLAYKGIPFDIGVTCGRKRPLIVAELGLAQRILMYISCGYVEHMERINYYLVKEMA